MINTAEIALRVLPPIRKDHTVLTVTRKKMMHPDFTTAIRLVLDFPTTKK